MTNDPDKHRPGAPSEDGAEDRGSQAILPFGDRLDEIARERFDRTDWIELAAAVLLALATIVAAWSAYQATRWGGVQANSFSAAGAKRAEATQANALYTAALQIDVQTWISWLEQRQARNVDAETFFYERFRDELRPAFDAWLAQVPAGEVPPGTPFAMPEYAPASRANADALNAEAEALSDDARNANQTSDNFVLIAVIMASVLFFAGVGTKLKGRGVRLAMLTLGALLFLGGVGFMFSMPQNVGL